MNELVQSIKNLGQTRLLILAGVTLLCVGALILLAVNSSSPIMSPIYSNLSTEDAALIVEDLEKTGIPYEIKANGTQINVPTDQVLRLRMTMAQQGIPSNGSVIGYEIFDKTEALGTSNFVLDINKQRSTEGELARTITSFSKIESARVHLVLPKRELFTRDKQEPSASVTLKMRGGNDLSKTEISAISHLVAASVPGLKVDAVTIVDNRGKLLAKGGGDGTSPEVMAAEADEYRVSYQNRMKATIENLLQKSVGNGKVTAEVNAEIDFDRIEKKSETFDPESQVARSIQGVEEKENSEERDVEDNVSVQNNLPDANANKDAGTMSLRNSSRTDETTNFEISKVIESQIKETGTVKRLSVSVLVDGTYVENNEGVDVYVPRKPEELKQLETLVRSAIGYDEARGDSVVVENMQFFAEPGVTVTETAMDIFRSYMDVIQPFLLFLAFLLVVLVVIRPLINRTIEGQQLAASGVGGADIGALGGPSLSARLTDQTGGTGMLEDEEESHINIDRIKGGVKSSTYKKINELVDKHPEETMQIIRQWVFKET